ncbi:MAG: magnesium transporter [Verrucomicrobiae bacterium]|nr:magnesium transporter [Verrucomicrobiae bacterium]
MSNELAAPPPEHERPWEELIGALEADDAAKIAELVDALTSEEARRAFSRLSSDDQQRVVAALSPEQAAELLESLPEAQAVDLLGEMDPETAADIVEQLPDNIGADLLQEMDEVDSEAVLAELDDADEADHLRELTGYPWDSAGGLMTEAFAAFSVTHSVGQVLQELSENAEDYSDLDVQYVYAVSDLGELRGVLRLRDLVLTPRLRKIEDIMIKEPASVQALDDLPKLVGIFNERDYLGLPVLNEAGIIQGVISREAVNDAAAEHLAEDYLHASGIVGGEELRSMPMKDRALRRLSWLAPNIILNLVAASVIAMYEDTIQAVIALAVFLPIVSDMSGCSGNQAVAVSIRELTLGLIRPSEFIRVVWKEGILGLINGLVLGILLGSIAAIWKSNVWLGLVIGSALWLNTILSVLLGGLVPLLLKRFKIDPALASGPILTTCTDMCGFFLVLNLASVVLAKLA